MAFFKFRKSGDDPPGKPTPSESVEAMRKRATFRLIGAAVLVLAGVIGFPLLFDSQPRPIPVDISIEIPDKTKVKPLAMPATGARQPSVGSVTTAAVAPEPAPKAPVAAAPSGSESAADAKKSSDAKIQQEKQPQADKNIEKSAIKKEEIIGQKEPVKSKINGNDGDRALALLDGKPANKSADKTAQPAEAGTLPDEKNDTKPAGKSDSRFVVQVGAYSDAARAREARSKLESAGLKTYAQVVETKDGPRTRVRVGPFSDKAEADRVAQKVKSLDLPAAILAL